MEVCAVKRVLLAFISVVIFSHAHCSSFATSKQGDSDGRSTAVRTLTFGKILNWFLLHSKATSCVGLDTCEPSEIQGLSATYKLISDHKFNIKIVWHQPEHFPEKYEIKIKNFIFAEDGNTTESDKIYELHGVRSQCLLEFFHPLISFTEQNSLYGRKRRAEVPKYFDHHRSFQKPASLIRAQIRQARWKLSENEYEKSSGFFLRSIKSGFLRRALFHLAQTTERDCADNADRSLGAHGPWLYQVDRVQYNPKSDRRVHQRQVNGSQKE